MQHFTNSSSVVINWGNSQLLQSKEATIESMTTGLVDWLPGYDLIHFRCSDISSKHIQTDCQNMTLSMSDVVISPANISRLTARIWPNPCQNCDISSKHIHPSWDTSSHSNLAAQLHARLQSPDHWPTQPRPTGQTGNGIWTSQTGKQFGMTGWQLPMQCGHTGKCPQTLLWLRATPRIIKSSLSAWHVILSIFNIVHSH